VAHVQRIKDIYDTVKHLAKIANKHTPNGTNNKGKQMETSTGELIARLMNLSNQLAIELRFNESSLVLEVVGLLHSLPTIAEQNRQAWHPSLNTSGASKGITYISTVKKTHE
jgi:hypothetical protein